MLFGQLHRTEGWASSSEGADPSWRVQLGEGTDGDLWEAVDLLLEGMHGRVTQIITKVTFGH